MSVPGGPAGAIVRLSVLKLSGSFHHQGPTGRELLSCADPAVVSARYQRLGEAGVWYGSSMQRGAWAEMFRHWELGGVSPYEIRRRVGRASVSGLRVLDLRDRAVQAALGLSQADLTGDDYALCQEAAALARAAGLDGVLAPSAALSECDTLAVFAHSLGDGRVGADHSRIQRPPATMSRQVGRIRSMAADPAGAASELWRLSVDVVRRRR